MRRHHRESIAILAVAKLGGRITVRIDDPFFMRYLLGDKYCQTAVAVSLAATDATDSDVQLLCSLTALESLDLSGTLVTEQCLIDLRALLSLKEINLAATHLPSNALVSFIDATSCRSLILDVDRDSQVIEEIARLRPSVSIGRMRLQSDKPGPEGVDVHNVLRFEDELPQSAYKLGDVHRIEVGTTMPPGQLLEVNAPHRSFRVLRMPNGWADATAWADVANTRWARLGVLLHGRVHAIYIPMRQIPLHALEQRFLAAPQSRKDYHQWKRLIAFLLQVNRREDAAQMCHTMCAALPHIDVTAELAFVASHNAPPSAFDPQYRVRLP
jgi:hypothetical protein